MVRRRPGTGHWAPALRCSALEPDRSSLWEDKAGSMSWEQELGRQQGVWGHGAGLLVLCFLGGSKSTTSLWFWDKPAKGETGWAVAMAATASRGAESPLLSPSAPSPGRGLVHSG